eukprot:CAMPEP_0118711196 /NCGR_PEP_ID=MMETSP0800-20121206/23918_1 /TAXON_ID=210618 ORGANISM="Striatella unipunctata, Strain CCMP2910" /NCGR_SAMPLE_ID=MMETSP0800 /ASSEMBLY_ACC=CAM_ASM_000638 /LENGTH=75 /DNA_ID=CAMNT_0006615693 /DNA_START=36 /DNA_END=259 /DNA_ORIENTATION=+
MDLSNRPCFFHDLPLEEEEYVGDLSTEMMEHVLDSLVMNAKMTVHVRNLSSYSSSSDANHLMDVCMATARAFGGA